MQSKRHFQHTVLTPSHTHTLTPHPSPLTRCCSRTEDVFFHFSSVSKDVLGTLVVGAEVEFGIQMGRGDRPAAFGLRLAADGAVSFVKRLEEERRTGVVVTPAKASRDKAEESARRPRDSRTGGGGGGSKATRPEDLGMVVVSSATKVVGAPDGIDGCPEESVLQYGLQDLKDSGVLIPGDVIEFTVRLLLPTH